MKSTNATNVVLCMLLLVLSLASVGATQPSLTVRELPVLTNQSIIIVNGTTDAGNTVKTYLGGALVSFTKANASGEWSDDIILKEGLNQLEIRALNPEQEQNSVWINVTRDTMPPIIVLNNFTNVIIDDKVDLSITFTENATATVFIDNQSTKVFREAGINFTTRITIRDKEEAQMKIVAEDSVGNKNIREDKLKKVGLPFINLTYPSLRLRPDQTAFSAGRTIPTSRTDHVLEGRATPFSEILVWVYQSSEQRPQRHSYKTTADLNGEWKVEISLKRTIMQSTEDDSFVYPGGYGYGDDTEDIMGHDAIVSTIENVENTIEIKAVDVYERETDTIQFTYKLTSCGTGQSFEVPAMLAGDEHSLKPYRLRDGTEMITFKIPLDYVGYGELEYVQNVWLKVQPLTQEMLSDPAYDCITKGRVFPNGPQRVIPGGQDKKYWYLMYNLNPWKGLNESGIVDYKKDFLDSLHNTCKIPLVLYVSYKLKDNPTSYTEEYCIETERFIDSELDPRSVLPEWLLDSSLTTLDFLIDSIETAEDPLRFTLDWTRRGCLVSLGYYIFTKIDARTSCTTGVSVNPAKSAFSFAASGMSVEGMIDRCDEKIEAEKRAYDIYRSTCDRVLCKDVPVRPDPTKPSDPPPVNVVSGGVTRPARCDENEYYTCVSPSSALGSNPGQAFAAFNQMVDRRCDPESRWVGVPGCTQTMHMPDNWPAKAICCLKRNAQNVVTEVTSIEELQGSDWNPDGMQGWVEKNYPGYQSPNLDYPAFEEPGVKLQDSDTDRVLFGAAEVDAWDYGMYAGYVTDRMSEYYDEESSNSGTLGIIDQPLIGPKALNPGNLIKQLVSLRLLGGSQLTENRGIRKVEFPYVDGLHYSQCFGQTGVWFDDDALFFQPRQNWQSSLQCGCISDIYGRMMQYKNVLVEMRNCLSQINQTGTASAGACKEMFARHVCDLFSWILVEAVLEQKNPGYQDYNEAQQKVDISNMQAVSLGFSDAWQQFRSDYGSSIGAGYMLSMQGVARQVCMGALFNEWDPGFVAAFSGDRRGSARQSSVLVYPAKREMLAASPITGIPIMEYQLGVWFSAGSNLRWVRVELVCDDEGDCPGEERVSLMRFGGGGLANSGVFRNVNMNDVLTPGGYMQTRDATYRFNKVRVRWKSMDGAQFDGEEVFDIEQLETLSLFDCQLRPSGTLTGNDIITCEILTDDSYATWITPPPSKVFLAVRGDKSKPQNFRYSFRLHTGALIDDESTNIGLKITKKTPQSKEKVLLLQELSDGLHTQDEFSDVVTFGPEDFGDQGPLIEGHAIEVEGNKVGQYDCNHRVLEPKASAKASVVLNAKYDSGKDVFMIARNTGNGLSIEPDKESYDVAEYATGSERKMEPINVTFFGSNISFFGLEDGEKCTITTQTGEKTQLVQVKFSLVYMKGENQIVDVVRNDVGEIMERTVEFNLQNQIQGGDAGEVEGEIQNFEIGGENYKLETSIGEEHKVSLDFEGGDSANLVIYKSGGSGAVLHTQNLEAKQDASGFEGKWKAENVASGAKYTARGVVRSGRETKESSDIIIEVT